MRARTRGGASTTPLFALLALASIGAVVLALVSQHGFGLQPCPWCVLQRLIYLLIGAFALLGVLWRGAAAGRVAGTFALLLAASGLAAALWHYFVASSSASCNFTLADRIIGATQLDRLVPGVFEARATCADAAVAILGVPYPIWSAIGYVVCAIIVLRILRLST